MFTEEFGWLTDFNSTHMTPAVPLVLRGKRRPQSVEIDVPSGELVFANDLGTYLAGEAVVGVHESAVSHRSGHETRSRVYAETANAFYVSVGNTCPTVWQDKSRPDRLRVGRAAEWDTEDTQWTAADANKSWLNCGSITTDAWCFTAVDLSRLPAQHVDSSFTVSVPPGRYRLLNRFEDDGSETGIFCEIERVGEVSNG